MPKIDGAKNELLLCDSKCVSCGLCPLLSEPEFYRIKQVIEEKTKSEVIKREAEKQTVFEEALAHWGIDIYIGQTGEEAAELIKELAELIQNLNHYKRNRTNSRDKLITEMAHVSLMLDIMRLAIMPGQGGKELFQEVINNEILRIRKKYETDNQNVDHE